jgi:type IV secretory pathway component VirB8
MTEPKPTNQALLLEVTHRLAAIESKLDVVSDHEDRIRELEKARYSTAWITSILSATLTAVLVALIIKVAVPV